MVHLQAINDFQSMKGISREFVKSQERFDQKMKIVVDLEKAHQQIIAHMKNSSLVVNELI